MIKRFLEWIGLKEKLHGSIHESPLISEGDIWWVSVGENVGKEINGRSRLFSRPVLVFKKLSHETFLCLPTTTKDKKGSWYVEINQNGRRINVVLSQARVFDSKRLSVRISVVDDNDMKKIKTGFQNLFLP
jgi:mRNA interferase MazF